jgi:hypothetical protein
LRLTGEGLAAIGEMCARSSCDFVALSVVDAKLEGGSSCSARTILKGADRSWQESSVSIVPKHDHDSITSCLTGGLSIQVLPAYKLQFDQGDE